MKRAVAVALALCGVLVAEPVHVAGLEKHDPFFAQGYILAP
jgi:hypothetical protein